MEWDLATLMPLLMFAGLFALIMTGFPVAFAICGTALYFALAGHFLGLFKLQDFSFLPGRVFGAVQNFELIAVPLFIFMGLMLEKSGLATDLLESMQRVLRRVHGGLAIGVILVGALLAATTGIVGATVVTMGAISLPTMLKWGYNKELACGTIAASGTLGQIIPPSIVLVLLGDMMNVDIGQLFMGAILPGLLLVAVYCAYVFLRVFINPELAPARVDEEGDSPRETALVLYLASSLLPPALLVIIVLGSILVGIASPTEAAACGAVGAILITLAKGRFAAKALSEVMGQTTSMTAMVFTILAGAQFFSVVFRGLKGDRVLVDIIHSFGVDPGSVLFLTMLIIFVLGFFIDFIEICFIVIPIVAPVLIGQLHYDPLWIAILVAVNLQTSFLTPPFGFALFYLKGVAPPEIKTLHLYRGVVPFVALQLMVLGLVSCFPAVATWLPRVLFR